MGMRIINLNRTGWNVVSGDEEKITFYSISCIIIIPLYRTLLDFTAAFLASYRYHSQTCKNIKIQIHFRFIHTEYKIPV